MKISVVIINWNNSVMTHKCVQELTSWKRIEPLIWIVDNASKEADITNLKKRTYEKVYYIFNDVNQGFAGGNNSALRRILAEDIHAVLLLNNDASISEENVEKLIESLESNPKLGVIGPVIYEYNSSETIISMGGRDIARHAQTRNYVSALSSLPLDNHLIHVDYVPGTVALIKIDLFRALGLFDETYFFSGEMADFCERARGQGSICAVDPRSTATHQFDSSSTVRQTLYLYYNLRNRFLFISKFRPLKKMYLYTFWIICGMLMGIKACVKFQWKKIRAITLALVHGLLGKFGNQNDKILS